MANLKQQTLKGSFWVLGSKAVDMVVRTILTAVLARIIAPEAYGTAQLATAFLNFIETIALLGVGPAIIQFQNLDRKILSSAFWFTTLTALFYCVIIFFCSGFVGAYFENADLAAVLKLYASLPIFVGISVIGESILIKKLDFRLQTKIELGSFLTIYLPVVLLMAFNGYGLWALVVANFANMVAKSFGYFWGSKLIPLWHFKWIEIKPLLRYGFGVSNARMFNVMANQADNLIVGKFFGATNLGFYSKSFNLMSLLIRTTGLITDRVLFSAFSKKQNEHEVVLLNLQRTSILVNYYAFPFAVLSIFLAEEIVLILYGENWLQSVMPFTILALVIPIRLSYKLPVTVLQALGYAKLVAQIAIQYTILVVLSCGLGAYLLGLKGVPIGIVVATCIQFVVIHARLTYVLKSYNFKKLWETFVPALKITALIGFSTATGFLFIQSMPFSRLVAAFLGVLLSAFIVFKFKNFFIPQEFFLVFNEVKKMKNAKKTTSSNNE